MAGVEGTRLNRLCLVGWSLNDAGRNDQGEQSIGARREDQTTLTSHQDVLHGWKGEGNTVQACMLWCKSLAGGSQLPKVELKVALRPDLTWTDSLSPHVRHTHTTRLGKSRCWDGTGIHLVVLPSKALELTTNTRTGRGPH